jgi:hypothetical protein
MPTVKCRQCATSSGGWVASRIAVTVMVVVGLAVVLGACGGGSPSATARAVVTTVVSTPGSGVVPTAVRTARREYPAGGPTDPVFPPGQPAYGLLISGSCGELLADTQGWASQGVAQQEGKDTPPLYMSAALVCLGRWDDAIRVYQSINRTQPDFGEGHVCERKAVLAWVASLVDDHQRDPSFSPQFVASSSHSPCTANSSTGTTTSPSTSRSVTTTSVSSSTTGR